MNDTRRIGLKTSYHHLSALDGFHLTMSQINRINNAKKTKRGVDMKIYQTQVRKF